MTARDVQHDFHLAMPDRFGAASCDSRQIFNVCLLSETKENVESLKTNERLNEQKIKIHTTKLQARVKGMETYANELCVQKLSTKHSRYSPKHTKANFQPLKPFQPLAE